MSQEKVNSRYSLTDSRVDNAGEGLRLLARIIARRLIARKSGANGQPSRPGLPASGADQKTRLQSPGTANKKRAVTPFGCSRRDIPDVLTKGEGSDG
jgi:hypothetical protein